MSFKICLFLSLPTWARRWLDMGKTFPARVQPPPFPLPSPEITATEAGYYHEWIPMQIEKSCTSFCPCFILGLVFKTRIEKMMKMKIQSTQDPCQNIPKVSLSILELDQADEGKYVGILSDDQACH